MTRLAFIVLIASSLFMGWSLFFAPERTQASIILRPLNDFDSFQRRYASFREGNPLDGAEVIAQDEDVYMLARQWEWTPALVLEAGKTYRLHLATEDIQHGFHLQKDALGEPVDVLIQPGWEYVIEINSLNHGTYFIGCSEYCGLEHNKMRTHLTIR